jgi:hypothetical protein
MRERGQHWCFTTNKTTTEDIREMRKLKESGLQIVVGKEQRDGIDETPV